MDFEELSKSNEEQLERWELECIYRHLNMFIQTQWDRKENVQDACYGCNHYCSKQELNPWPAFYKLANLSQVSKEEKTLEDKIIKTKKRVKGHIGIQSLTKIKKFFLNCNFKVNLKLNN